MPYLLYVEPTIYSINTRGPSTVLCAPHQSHLSQVLQRKEAAWAIVLQ